VYHRVEAAERRDRFIERARNGVLVAHVHRDAAGAFVRARELVEHFGAARAEHDARTTIQRGDPDFTTDACRAADDEQPCSFDVHALASPDLIDDSGTQYTIAGWARPVRWCDTRSTSTAWACSPSTIPTIATRSRGA
jgi:hypothetical protein